MPPLASVSRLAAPFSANAPCEEEEDSWTTLCPTGGVAWTVLHIINLGTTAEDPEGADGGLGLPAARALTCRGS